MTGLLQIGIRPIVVFDGKMNEAKLRHQDKNPDTLEKEIKLSQQIEEVVEKLVIALHSNGISHMTAPYEADAQLAWLCKNNLIDAVLTTDSDLACYGAKKVICF